MNSKDKLPTGVIYGEDVKRLFNRAHKEGFAIPAVNCTTSSTVNATLEAARDINSPIIIQFSYGGAAFFTGKGLPNDRHQASIAGAIAGAKYIHEVAHLYKVPVIIHSDHCAKKLLPWMDGMLEADEEYFKKTGRPLYSSHMLDLSEEPKEENIRICVEYLKRMAPMNCLLEMEIGITGGEEDGVDNTSVDNAALYTQPTDVWDVYSALSAISDLFTIAAAFGNVHGVYKPGNVRLHPELLARHQKYIHQQLHKIETAAENPKPMWFVFHGGSGSTEAEIKEAVQNGVVKMNVDTDTQWAYWQGIHQYYEEKKDYLQSQVGNPGGPDKPNKKYYDPRTFIREAEKSMIKRVQEACRHLGNVNKL